MEKLPSTIKEQIKKVKDQILDTVLGDEATRKKNAEKELLHSLGTVDKKELDKYKDEEKEKNY